VTTPDVYENTINIKFKFAITSPSPNSEDGFQHITDIRNNKNNFKKSVSGKTENFLPTTNSILFVVTLPILYVVLIHAHRCHRLIRIKGLC